MVKLWMIIGVPGSGKSTLAEKISTEQESILGYKPKIFEADMYFIDPITKEYKWIKEHLPDAHMWCYTNVSKELQAGRSVIVANTFIKRIFRSPYIRLAKEFNAELEVITCTGNFKNIHGVPEETIKKFKELFQPFSNDELNTQEFIK